MPICEVHFEWDVPKIINRETTFRVKMYSKSWIAKETVQNQVYLWSLSVYGLAILGSMTSADIACNQFRFSMSTRQ